MDTSAVSRQLAAGQSSDRSPSPSGAGMALPPPSAVSEFLLDDCQKQSTAAAVGNVARTQSSHNLINSPLQLAPEKRNAEFHMVATLIISSSFFISFNCILMLHSFFGLCLMKILWLKVRRN
jgi:hypothetical protein